MRGWSLMPKRGGGDTQEGQSWAGGPNSVPLTWHAGNLGLGQALPRSLRGPSTGTPSWNASFLWEGKPDAGFPFFLKGTHHDLSLELRYSLVK